MKPTYEELEEKCAALAAENAGLKAEHELALQYMDELRANFNMYKKFKCQSQSDVTTPATDAFLAEVRAQGVEMFAAVLRRKGDDGFFDAIAEAQANAADQFAAQILKGAAS
ncbi:hypothetical protein [Enterobacter ludwigii]|uniref:hypothetical protein n=1 Tax=Enterobacter ludwigii TaxID=299767 RepID=UPI00406984DF